ncbi:methyltransferase domain-containing protein [Streptacidiphilus sp. PB12-B1b]|uniref:class I SAM-dependent methyltransferase n=1 Tax=Streptacidiphilus sp. PB12-B1b TaxID=2705012 RepID=UPI0015FC39F5|nr:methyltransferase domain-containing protein [Streptacidiphilus sp. PB12-B1b]QMU78214.1 methyltransferase domain-containing protein [Streptacidiphilus sp. PB12-B1b]
MSLMTQSEFDTFFEPYAGNVEGFYEATYWHLADEVIKELIRRHLGLQPGQRVLDVGGGTGRWGIWLAGEFGVSVTVADKSADMLRQAEANRLASPVADSVELVHCDIENAPELASESFDAVISTYGVLSFLDDPAAAFATIQRVMRPGAAGFLMSHSLSNALSSKILRDGAGAAELAEIQATRTVKWSAHVPSLRLYDADELRSLAAGAGLTGERVFGVTSLALPGAEDFGYPYDRISDISRALEDKEYFATVLGLELEASEHDSWAERGTNLAIKVRRP